MNHGLKKQWMLFGITMAKLFPFLHKAKMKVGDAMVLSCTLTMPIMLDGKNWPDKKPLLVMFRAPKDMDGGELWVADPLPDGKSPPRETFEKLSTKPMPLMGGAAYIFITDNFDQRRWYIVRCEGNDRTQEADPVLSKIDQGPSGFEMQFVETDNELPTTFDWQEAPNDDHWIHFLVVSQNNNLLSGIYTSHTKWLYGQFGDLPYYIHDPMKTQPLKANEEYDIMYHAVDNEGWVSMSCMRKFNTSIQSN